MGSFRLFCLRCLLVIFSFFTFTSQAQENYRQHIDDIAQRLEKTIQFYQQGQIDEARTEVQMAYFEVFENLGG